MASSQWGLIPASILLYSAFLPRVLNLSQDACAIVSLFITASLFVSSLLDEKAVHGLLVADPSDPSSRSLWRSLVRGANWALGMGLLLALVQISDIHINAETPVPETRRYNQLLVFVFLGLTYYGSAFAFSCTEHRHRKGGRAGLGLVVGAVAPALTYLIIVAYVTVRFNASLLPLILTTDAAVILSVPVLYTLALSRLRSGSSQARQGRFAAPRQPLVTGPVVTYAVCLLISLRFAPPRTVAVLLALLPGRMLHASQDWVTLFPSTITEVSEGLREQAEGLLAAPVNLTVRDALLAGVLTLLLVSFAVSSRSKNNKEKSEMAAAVARKRLTKLRAASKTFPPPYPNGWYHICNSDDIPEGRALAASACNKEFVVFRDETDKVAVLHAYCTHLGTHLGHGGQVKNGKVVCPYHSWTFDKDGKCQDIPYCSKTPGDKTHTKAYHSRERLGMVWVWLHADGLEPNYELTLFDEIEEQDMQYTTDVPVENWQMHIMEASQNAADTYHFNTVHQWLGADDMHGTGGWLWVRHETKSRLALLGNTELPPTVISLDEKCVEMWLFGCIPVPDFFNSHYSSGAAFQGPQVSVFRIDTKALGSCRIVFSFTPESPFEQRCTVRVFRTKGFPSFMAATFGKWAVKTVNQDREVWEHKLAVAPRNVVAGDGPFAAYGTWLRQFYSESSQTWGDISLEW